MNLNGYIYNLGMLFEHISCRYKNNIALRFTDGAFCKYVEINELSNQIANYMLDGGLRKNDVVAILNNKSRMSYSIMLACLKIGVIYTNLDPRSPIDRFNKMLRTCSPKILFYFGDSSRKSIAEEIDYNDIIKIVDYESGNFSKLIDKNSILLPEYNKKITGMSPAYIMFTSGSTGFPKGVVISHSNVINFIEWSKETYKSSDIDVFTGINPMHFDNSVFDFYSSLFIGASLVAVPDDLVKNPRKLLDALNPLQPSIWFSVPSMLVYVLNMRALRDNDLLFLRIVTFGGEGFPKNQLRVLWSRWGHRAKFVNVYGPTECTCICSSYLVAEKDIDSEDLLPLGPIANNFYAIIIDSEGKEVADGEIGELCIGGSNVGLGYYNNKQQTDSVFVDNPEITSYSEKIYKSGDLVRREKGSGLLHFCGRKDNQIKRMGYRIELEEIESAFNSLHYIAECAVIFVNTDKIKEKIIACICSDLADELTITADLKTKLPSYMMPDHLVFYEQLPKNQNGKIDRLKIKEEYLK